MNISVVGGGEDKEIMLRADLFNLKHYRINDVLYHLYHKRDKKRSKNNFNLEEKDPATSK